MTLGPEFDIVVRAANPDDPTRPMDLSQEAVPAVFVDSTGRRRRRIRGIAYGVGGASLAYTVLLGVSLAGGPVSPYALLPFPELVDRLPVAPQHQRNDRPALNVAAPPGKPAVQVRHANNRRPSATPVPSPAGQGSTTPAPPPVESTVEPNVTVPPIDPTPEPEPPQPSPSPEPVPTSDPSPVPTELPIAGGEPPAPTSEPTTAVPSPTGITV
ncbi:MAG TPA: hypothetical protein VFC00_23055 [Micromonosporaceae bacterium]|nr:hypothetical protein [Micromonosporaceae bacterium]